jgi:hypothetical protein
MTNKKNNYDYSNIGMKLVDQMDQLTFNRIGEKSIKNINYNQKNLYHGQSISNLKDEIGKFENSIIIAAGPSIKREDPISTISKSDFKGKIVTTESGLYYCLKNNLIPDLIVTIDPHESRIVRWFGNPNLSEEELENDDYYRRQDMDEAFANEKKVNEDLINLIDKNCKGVPIALSTASSKAVVDRVVSVGMDIYWFNPMLDDPDIKNSHTMAAHLLNKLPCINCGGNVGTAAWMILDEVLKSKRIALTGVDFSYYNDTSYVQTQYYNDALAIFGEENLDDFFIKVHNPYLNKEFFTDPAYLWYKNIFLELVKDGSSETYNCTNGGIVFGDGISFINLKEYINLCINSNANNLEVN